ncbi:MAG: hypothetical protein LBI27_09715 [Clostridiales bacterium]|jgi:flagellar assembly protein FliH|nr:hypothetical protein [Clostridiales bacterium]
MLSFRQILKPAMVNLDTENKIVIETGSAPIVNIYDDDVTETVDIKRDAEKAAARIIRHAERQAEEIISNSRMAAIEEKELLLKSAQDETERVISEARDMGYKNGMDTATREGDALKAQAQQILDDAIAEREAMQNNLEPEIVEMIIGITEKLLGNIADVNPAIIVNLVKQGFASSQISGNITVHVSADDFEAVKKNKDELLAHTDGSVKLTITKDLSLSPLDCIIETPFGDIDCSLGQQFESLRANLTYILNNK